MEDRSTFTLTPFLFKGWWRETIQNSGVQKVGEEQVKALLEENSISTPFVLCVFSSKGAGQMLIYELHSLIIR